MRTRAQSRGKIDYVQGTVLDRNPTSSYMKTSCRCCKTYKTAKTYENFLSDPNSFVNISYKIFIDNYGREGVEDRRK